MIQGPDLRLHPSASPAGDLASPFSLDDGFERQQTAAPEDIEQAPHPASEAWAGRARAVLEEARQAVEEISGHRWMVAHPADLRMADLIAQIETGTFQAAEVETPRLVRWRSSLDGRTYTLVEFLRLARHEGEAENA